MTMHTLVGGDEFKKKNSIDMEQLESGNAEASPDQM